MVFYHVIYIRNQEQTHQEDPEVPVEDGNMGNVTGEAETMSEKDQREAAMAIEVFGLPTVSRCCNLKEILRHIF